MSNFVIILHNTRFYSIKHSINTAKIVISVFLKTAVYTQDCAYKWSFCSCI